VLSEVVLLACKDLIDDAKIGCADLVFKDVCLEVLAKARLVLSNEQFEELTFFVAERMKDERVPGLGRKVRIR
jgi:dsDNA-binding SOS-regulon protein